MNRNRLLRLAAAAVLLFGVVSFAAARVPAIPFVLAGQTAFWTGVIAISVGVVLLATLRRDDA